MEARQPLDFESVYSDQAPHVRRLLVRSGVRPSDLDDVLQEVFVAVHRQLPGFEGRSRIETWLHSVAWRVAANYHRSDRTRADVPQSAAPTVIDEDASEAVPSSRLRTMFGAVEEPHRDVLALHDVGGLSISELADLTGNARATIRQRVERGRAALGRRIRNALTARDQDAWLEQFAPRLERPRLQLPLTSPIICEHNAFSSLNNIVVAVWRGPCPVTAVEALIPVMIATAEANEDGFCFLSVIDPEATPPARQARELNAWVAAKLGPVIKAAAWVADSSILTTLVAPVINTSLFLAGIPLNLRFFGDLAPATSWLDEYGSSDARQIAAHVEVMRHCLGHDGRG